MAMKRLALLAILAFAPLLALADVAGTWNATFTTQIGEQVYVYTFVVDGTTLTGTAKSSLSEMTSELKDGKIEGDTISFVENLNYQGMDLVITYKGTVAGDEIKFSRMVGEFATEELVARRAE
jgi:hypothetical protein